MFRYARDGIGIETIFFGAWERGMESIIERDTGTVAVQAGEKTRSGRREVGDGEANSIAVIRLLLS